MPRRNLEFNFNQPSIMPFLDIIFSTIGILIVVFALQEIISNKDRRQPMIDHLIICTEDNRLQLYLNPDVKPVLFNNLQVPALLETLAVQQTGVRNLVFALTSACFNTQRLFEQEFTKFATLANDRQASEKTVFRLIFRPLSVQAGAVQQLLDEWRGAESADGNTRTIR